MAKFTFNMPDVGEGVAEAEVVDWQVKVGDAVEEDQHIVDVMTDKATIDIESPVTGTVIEVAGDVGDTIAVGAMLLVIEVEGEDESSAEASANDEAATSVPEPKTEVEPAPAPALAPAAAAEPEVEIAPVPAFTQGEIKVLATPAVRKRARDLGIDLGEVKPAADGRVRHADLDAFLSYNSGAGFAAAGATRSDEPIKVIGLRKRIAQNMAASKRSIPHFSYVEEVDVTAMEQMRADLNANRGNKPKLTMLPLLVTAICKLIPQYPMINARYDDEANIVTRHGAVHLGIAAQTDNGLMVPVVKDAQSKNIWQLAREIVRLADAARDGSASSDELSGSTLTITSLGPLGGVATTPVINRPEVAIIGPNRIIERPMFVPDGQGGERIEKRKLMNISISCDHRVVDGYDAASFIQEVKKLVETPVLLLSE
ncbi:MAG: dihydrolipoamide acetyltransferase family protein [Erythrobacter sp.]